MIFITTLFAGLIGFMFLSLAASAFSALSREQADATRYPLR